MAEIYDAITAQREAIERGEKEMLRQLTRNWMPAYRVLQKRIDDLTELIETKRAEGELVSWSYIYALDRYRTMMAEAERAVDSYNQAAQGLITGAEADAVDLGTDNARQIVSMAEPENPMWTRINKRETRIMSGMLSEPSPLSKLLSESWPLLRDHLDEALLAGISAGMGAQWIAKRMAEQAGIPLKRATTIARTEVNRAYRQANLETMRSSRTVKGYRRLCYKPTACFACLMLDGEYYDKKEDFSDHPNGKCSAVPVTKHFDPINDEDWESGSDWFRKLSEEEQRKLIGHGRYEAWKADGINPKDMVYIKQSELWGGSPTVKTLDQINLLKFLK